ncbi:MAG: metallophosphoesterase family protein [Bacteroidota bacterium]
MTRIALLSDTHGHIDDQLLSYVSEADEIWHAGDIGNYEVVKALRTKAPVKAVYGNIDGADLRKEFPEHLRFYCEEVEVWITHIGGYPGRYDRRIRTQIANDPPRLFICGHSHILKVMNDKKLGLLHMNPGACGKQGFHQVRTLLRFTINGEKIEALEVAELGKR